MVDRKNRDRCLCCLSALPSPPTRCKKKIIESYSSEDESRSNILPPIDVYQKVSKNIPILINEGLNATQEAETSPTLVSMFVKIFFYPLFFMKKNYFDIKYNT